MYCHANGSTLDETVASVAHYIEMGFKAVRAQCGVPGVKHAYGIPRDGKPYEPAEKGLPLETVWSTERYLDFIPTVFDRLRRELGSGCTCCTTYTTGSRRSKRRGWARASSRLACSGWRTRFRPRSRAPSASSASTRRRRLPLGEVFNTIYDCHTLIEEELIDYIRTTVVHAGGLSHLRKIAALAELHHVRTGCHGATDLSPVTMAAALHFDLSVHNFGIQELMPHSADTDRVFPHAYTFEAGVMHPGDRPGLGVDIDEALAATFPYDPAYLPVARKIDGTLHSW